MSHADATLALWLEWMDKHSQRWHHLLFLNLILSLVQMDELYTRVRQTVSPTRRWLIFDLVSKAVSALHVGGGTKDDAFALVHDLKGRLDPECVPAVTTGGLHSCLYALSTHFGLWFRPPRTHTDYWQPSENLYYGQLVKRKDKRRATFTHTHMVMV